MLVSSLPVRLEVSELTENLVCLLLPLEVLERLPERETLPQVVMLEIQRQVPMLGVEMQAVVLAEIGRQVVVLAEIGSERDCFAYVKGSQGAARKRDSPARSRSPPARHYTMVATQLDAEVGLQDTMLGVGSCTGEAGYPSRSDYAPSPSPHCVGTASAALGYCGTALVMVRCGGE